MTKLKYTFHGLLFLLLTLCQQAIAQEVPNVIILDEAGEEIYLQQLEEQRATTVAQFEAFPPPEFKGTDLNGEEHVLTDFEGQVLVLFFWSSYHQACLDLIPQFNELTNKNSPDVLRVISFADDQADVLQAFLYRFYSSKPLNFPVIPNASNFSREHFGAGLGYPKIFVIDKYQTTRKIYHSGMFRNNENGFAELESLVNDLLRE